MSKLNAILGRRWRLLAFLTALGVLVGLATSFFAADDSATQYRARQTLGAIGGANGNQVSQDALRITRPVVLDRAAEILDDGSTSRQLARSITANPDTESNTIVVAATADTRDEAEQRVQAAVDAFLAEDSAAAQAQIQPQIDDATRRVEVAKRTLEEFDANNATQMATLPPGDPTLVSLQQQRRQLEIQIDEANGQLSTIEASADASSNYKSFGSDPAVVANDDVLPVPGNPVVRGLLFGLLGLILGLGVVALLERYSGRVDTREELADAIDLPLIAEVGDVEDLTDAEGRVHLDGVLAEPYRRVRSAIHYARSRAEREGLPPVSTVLFTSTFPSEGKSTSASLTALALAEVGYETMVVSADFRKPTIEKMLGTPTRPSLQDLAKDAGRTLSVDDVVHPASQDHLWVAASGDPTRDTTGALQAARDVVAVAVERGGMVIIDSPPVLAANDSIDLVDGADQVILVVRSGRSTKRGINETVTLLEQHGSNILGIIFVGAPGARSLAEYYRGYYESGIDQGDAVGPRDGPRFPESGLSTDSAPANGTSAPSGTHGRTRASDPKAPDRRGASNGAPLTSTSDRGSATRSGRWSRTEKQ